VKKRTGFLWCSFLGFIALFLIVLWGNLDTEHLGKTSSLLKGKEKVANDVTPPNWLKKYWSRSWVNKLDKHPEVLSQWIGTGASKGLRRDAYAFWNNDLARALKRQLEPKKLSPEHRILRARMHLQMVRFYQQSVPWLLDMGLTSLQRHTKLSATAKGEHKVGRLFGYHFGRLLCIQGQYQQGISMLERALHEVPSNRRQRVQTWQLACRFEKQGKKKRKKLASSLSSFRFSNDPDGWAEWIWLHHHYRLKALSTPVITTQRSRIFDAAWRRKRLSHEDLAPKFVGLQEVLKSKDFTYTIRYQDPLLFKVLEKYHAREALRFLALSNRKDRYAVFFRGQAYQALGEEEQARKAFEDFLRRPPSRLSWPYLIFSPWMSPADLVWQARLKRLSWMKAKQRHNAVSHLRKKALKPLKKLSLALTLTQLGVKKVNIQKYKKLFHDLENFRVYLYKRSRVRRETQKSQFIRSMRLFRYSLVPFVLPAARIALREGDFRWGILWLSLLRLEEVDFFYGAGSESYPAQILLMAELNYRSKYSFWDMFALTENDEKYPLLRQHLNLVRENKALRRLLEGPFTLPKPI